MRVLLDTHSWVWALTNGSALSGPARNAIARAEAAFVSTISVYEIAQKVRRNAWPTMTRTILDRMIAVEGSGVVFLPPSVEIMNEAGYLEWDNRDPFDRMIAATAIVEDLTVITKDKLFQDLKATTVLW